MCNLLAEAEEAVVEGVASSYSLLTQREPQHQVKLHVLQLSEAHTDPVSMSTEQGPAEPTKGPRDGYCPLDKLVLSCKSPGAGKTYGRNVIAW